MKILFVEDEANARIGLKALLCHDGHQVDEASDADEAVRKLRSNAYDCILLDVVLPPGKALHGVPFREVGKELLLSLRAGSFGKLQTSRQVPVVVLTAVGDMDLIAEIRNTSHLVLLKPIEPVEAVSEMLRAGILPGHRSDAGSV